MKAEIKNKFFLNVGHIAPSMLETIFYFELAQKKLFQIPLRST
jgi:hypothetical protein